jgi:hypothetical protein
MTVSFYRSDHMAAMTGLQQSLLQLLDRLPKLQQESTIKQASVTQVRCCDTSQTV